MSQDLEKDIKGCESDLSRSEKSTVFICGLGYVGLPLAVAFSREGYETYGHDIDRGKLRKLKRGHDPTGEIGDREIRDCDISYREDVSGVSESDYILITVPTPVTESNEPNTELLRAAGEAIGEHLSKGTTVILESTVYPGATREVLVPALEESSRMTAEQDFQVGYSPERIVPGRNGPGLRDAVKIVSGQDESTRDDIETLYRSIVDSGVHPAPSIEIAEAAKCLENAQRDLNIAFVNEFAIACHRTDLDVNAQDVLDAAGTKWNFHDYSPGLVGGHCVPVDPYYLIHAFEKDGFSPDLMKTAREVNDSVPTSIAEMIADVLREQGLSVDATGSAKGGCEFRSGASDDVPRALMIGLTYKPNTNDVRSRVLPELIDHVRALGLDPVGFDPHVDREVTTETFDIPIQEELSFSGFEVLIVSTPHDEFRELDLKEVRNDMADDPIVIDVSGAFDPDEVRKYGFTYKRF